MKAMKLMVMAVVVVVTGSTLLTSCLDSEDSNYPDEGAWVTIDGYSSYLTSVKSDYGDIFNVLNPSAMLLGSASDAYFPTRALIYYNFPEGTVREEGKTTYDIEFVEYGYATTILSNITLAAEEGGTDLEVWSVGGGKDYLDISFATWATKESSNSNYKLVVNKAEDKTLHLEVVNTEEVKSSDTDASATAVSISYRTPNKMSITSIYPELEFMGQTNDSVYVKIVNKVNGYDMEKFKIKLK